MIYFYLTWNGFIIVQNFIIPKRKTFSIFFYCEYFVYIFLFRMNSNRLRTDYDYNEEDRNLSIFFDSDTHNNRGENKSVVLDFQVFGTFNKKKLHSIVILLRILRLYPMAELFFSYYFFLLLKMKAIGTETKQYVHLGK